MINMKKRLIECPICANKSFDYICFKENVGTVEQHGYCGKCGYTLEQAYSPVFDCFVDIKKGIKFPNGQYLKKNVREHKRYRRKCKLKGIPINPYWSYYL